jgi:acetyl/propionyl-CoA carboxylase alpha subunit
VRVDAGLDEGGEVTPFYDPMIAKLIAHADTRVEAIADLAKACAAVEVWPLKTNAGFLARCLAEPDFIAGEVNTGFIEARLEALTALPKPSEAVLSAAAATAIGDFAQGPAADPWQGLTGFRQNGEPQRGVRLFLVGEAVICTPLAGARQRSAFVSHEGDVVVFETGEAFVFKDHPPAADADDGAAGEGQIRAPMPGKITQLLVKVGDTVIRGQALVTLEAMKMEHALQAPFAGVIEEVTVALGGQVIEGAPLVRLTQAEAG